MTTVTLFDLGVKPQPFTAGLEAEWKLSDYADATGNGYTLTGTNTPTFSTGQLGNAIYLARASNQYAGIANASIGALQPTGSFSVTAWVYPASGAFGNYRSICGIGVPNTATDSSWGLYTFNTANTPRFFVSLDGTTITNASSTNTLGTGAWKHMAATYNVATGDVKIYVDGSSLGSTNANTGGGTAHVSSQDFQVGCFEGSSSRAFDGRIDEVKYWTRELTSTEVAYDYNSGTGREIN